MRLFSRTNSKSFLSCLCRSGLALLVLVACGERPASTESPSLYYDPYCPESSCVHRTLTAEDKDVVHYALTTNIDGSTEYCSSIFQALEDMLEGDGIGTFEPDVGIWGDHHAHSEGFQFDMDVFDDFFEPDNATYTPYELAATLVHEMRHHNGEEHPPGENFEDDYICTPQNRL